jgi:hypothetical protein
MTQQQWRRQPPPFSVSPKATRDVGMIVFAAVMIFLLLALVAFLVWAWRHGDARYAEFMSGCEQDHKHYECMLLWRASGRDDLPPPPPPIIVQVPR